jgi:hypothetical protein
VEQPGESEWDFFISHDSRDKGSFVRSLAVALTERRLKVWYDEFTLSAGDSLSASIDRGLLRSRFGVVVLSPNFIVNERWAREELGGLFTRGVGDGKFIVPILHNIDFDTLARFSPMLANKFSLMSSDGVPSVADALARLVASESEADRTQRIVDGRKILKIDAWSKAYVHLDSIYSLRQELYSSFPKDFRSWTAEQKAKANKITIALNRVAFFVYQGLLEEELVLNENAGTFIWSWERLEGLVRELRRLSNQSESAEENPPDKGTPQRYHFEWLAKRAQRRFPGLSLMVCAVV